MALRIVAVVALVAICSGEQWLKCQCSPTTRGFNDGEWKRMLDKRDKIIQLEEKLVEEGKLTAVQIEQKKITQAGEDWADCIDNYSWEQCVNVDAALRRGSCYPNCKSYCQFDESTWQNYDQRRDLAPACNTNSSWTAADPEIVGGKPDEKSAIRPTPSASPSPASTSSDSGSSDSDPGAAAGGKGTGTSTDPNDFSVTIPGSKPGAVTPARADEGCVAVEHLRGYRMSHREHYVRPVLCHEGFCATPNHAIIVGGVWTSMKRLCTSQWSCVRTVKEVNNLDVFRNRRAQVGDITITPYDLRFPRAGVFLVQALEKLLYVVLDRAAAIAAAAAVVLASVVWRGRTSS